MDYINQFTFQFKSKKLVCFDGVKEPQNLYVNIDSESLLHELIEDGPENIGIEFSGTFSAKVLDKKYEWSISTFSLKDIFTKHCAEPLIYKLTDSQKIKRDPELCVEFLSDGKSLKVTGASITKYNFDLNDTYELEGIFLPHKARDYSSEVWSALFEKYGQYLFNTMDTWESNIMLFPPQMREKINKQWSETISGHYQLNPDNKLDFQ